MIDTLAAWHALVKSRDTRVFDALLHDDVVFHSPVVHTPQHGRAITTLYLTGALHVLDNEHFRYERQIVGARDAVLEFVTQIDGVHVNGIDLIRWDDSGRIVDFKVMVRPLKAVNALHRKMGEMLQALAPQPDPSHAAVPSTPPGRTMNTPSFEEFQAHALAQGFDEVIVREWAPGQVVGVHAHPFEVNALVVRGQLALTCGEHTRELAAGDRFELARDTPHTERYGPEGATFWVARRHATV